jgi:hypothetical protein
VSANSKAGHAANSASPAGTDPAATGSTDLRHEIERIRGQLATTVGQLATKADVTAARGRAAELRQRMTGKAGQARSQASARAGSLRGRLARKGAAGQKARSARPARRAEVRDRLGEIGVRPWEAAPAQVREAVAKVSRSARRRRAPLAIAAGLLVLGYLIVRRWRSQ